MNMEAPAAACQPESAAAGHSGTAAIHHQCLGHQAVTAMAYHAFGMLDGLWVVFWSYQCI
jgi:hypothetical protein